MVEEGEEDQKIQEFIPNHSPFLYWCNYSDYRSKTILRAVKFSCGMFFRIFSCFFVLTLLPFALADLSSLSQRPGLSFLSFALPFLTLLPFALADLPPLPQRPGFSLLYEDDFNNGLNPSIWTARNNYVHTRWDLVCFISDDVKVEDGNMVIVTRVNPVTCTDAEGTTRNYRYSSGWADTNGKLAVRNGLVEIRAKLPEPLFRMWPSSFLLSQENNLDQGKCWPLSTEIDLYEVAGGFGGDANTGLGSNAMCSSYHWGNQCFVDLGAKNTGCLSSVELCPHCDYHTYASAWDDTKIEFFIDGRLYFTIDKSSGATIPVPDPMVVIIQSALAWWIPGTSVPGLDPDVGGPGVQVHLIDWIRVWQRSV